MHVVRREGDARARPPQPRRRCGGAAGGVALGNVGDVHTGVSDAFEIVVVEKQAVGGDEALVQQTDVVEQLGRGDALPLPDPLDLDPALREVGVDPETVAGRGVANPLQQRTRAGIRGMRRQMHAEPTVHGAMPSLDEGDGVAEGLLADRVLVLPDLLVHPGEVDIVNPAAGPDPHSGLAHGRQGVPGVNVAVVDEGGAEQQRFERAEPAQRDRFVRGDVMAVRDPPACRPERTPCPRRRREPWSGSHGCGR